MGLFKKRVDYRHGLSSVFLRPPELTKIVLPKVLQNFQKCTSWPKELNQKSFPRNIQYRTRPNLHFRFFRHCATFSKKNFMKGFPIHQYFEILKSFLLFLSLGYGAVPGLFTIRVWRKYLMLSGGRLSILNIN